MESKKKKTLYWIIGILLVVGLFWFLSDTLEISFAIFGEERLEDNFSNIEEYHFSQMPITYILDIDTILYTEQGIKKANDEYEVQRIKWALSIIENVTDGLVNFQEEYEYNMSDIIINGYPPLEDSDSNFITEGFGGPTEIIDNLITHAEVDFYCEDVSLWRGKTSLEIRGDWLWEITEYDPLESISWEVGDCKNFPNTEIHEILHALSFGHNYNNSYSIMAPIKHKIQSCKTEKIDEEIVSCLKYIYSNGKIEGDCSNLEMYPFLEEQEIEDFKWERLPVTYSVSYCNDRQKWNLQQAEKVIEKYVGYDLYEFKEFGKGKINFYCHDSFDNVLLNEETDFWDETVYFPSAQPYFYFDDVGSIQEVEILLFAQNRTCGGIEVHELLHGIGLRKHYGHWMKYETEVCNINSLVIGTDSIEKVKEIYGLE